MPFAAVEASSSTGFPASGRSHAALGLEVRRRSAAVLAEIEGLTDRVDAGDGITAAELLHAADRVAALRTTIAARALLAGLV